jgi:ribosomal protein S18 acetylase RimI-like enzyme
MFEQQTLVRGGYLIKANIEDLKRASNVFAKAMFKDPLHIYFFPNETSRFVKLIRLYRFKLKMDFKHLYTTADHFKGFVIWKSSKNNNSKYRIIDIVRGAILILSIGLGPIIKMIKYQKWINRLHKRYLKKNYCCLDVLVINPSFQGQGISRSLVRPKIAELTMNDEIAFLETQNRKNVYLYEHFGFKLIYQERLPKTDIISYGMINN